MTRHHRELIRAFAVLLMLAGFLGSCTGGGEGPEIANLTCGLTEIPVSAGGTTTVTGTFNIIHENGETESVNTVVFDGQGKEIGKGTVQIGDPDGRKSQTLAFGADAVTATKGTYTYRVFVTDNKGRQSNKLAGSFAVTDVF